MLISTKLAELHIISLDYQIFPNSAKQEMIDDFRCPQFHSKKIVLAWKTLSGLSYLYHDESVFAKGRALHREGGGGASIDGSEFKLVRHHEGQKIKADRRKLRLKRSNHSTCHFERNVIPKSGWAVLTGGKRSHCPMGPKGTDYLHTWGSVTN